MSPTPERSRKFLVIADGSAEFGAALRFACRRARSTGGTVAVLQVLAPAVFEHWSGVRDEIERQARESALEAAAVFTPLVTSIAREGVRWGGRNLPVTIVPGDLSDAEIDDLA